ncbi:hypothetical protein HPP92_011689 [Vanilla planifolia]|uniref:Uncharacterized protein n=1 Tax=Vanilla planifolia TaxID=51239 RepID=A0A835R198_VANPL|nr:hypothetical protein HPP92_012015 [Vanilla planifolia]KAG0483605.1 hypothetical protein HPP92_011689 [Vanilla planifolia]
MGPLGPSFSEMKAAATKIIGGLGLTVEQEDKVDGDSSCHEDSSGRTRTTHVFFAVQFGQEDEPSKQPWVKMAKD